MKKFLKFLIFIIIIFFGYLSYYKFIQTNGENKEKITNFFDNIVNKAKSTVNDVKESTENKLEETEKDSVKDSTRVRSLIRSAALTTISTLENEYNASLLVDNGFAQAGDCMDYATNKQNYNVCTYSVVDNIINIHLEGKGIYEGLVVDGTKNDLKIEFTEE